MNARIARCPVPVLTVLLAAGLVLATGTEGYGQDATIVITPVGQKQVSWAPTGPKPVIAQPYCLACPGTSDTGVRAWVKASGSKVIAKVTDDVSVLWSSNLFGATEYTIKPFKVYEAEPHQPSLLVRTHCSEQLQNVSRELRATMAFVDFAWTHTPFQETFHFTGTVKVAFTDGTDQVINVDEKLEVYLHGCGSQAPPTKPGGPCIGGQLVAGKYTFIWKAPGTLIWQNAPKGEIIVDQNVPSLARVRAVASGSGPVIIYQRDKTIRYKMYEPFKGAETASGDIGPGELVKVDFIPAAYGAKALVTAQQGAQTAFYMFHVDQWGKAGTTRQVGNTLATNKSHWTVQYHSVVYLFEFDPATGTLTCKDNYKGWSTTVDSGITGLVVPTATGGGAIVVYEKQKMVHGVLLYWESGAAKEHRVIGNGTLLQVTYTLRGSYGANGIALVKTSSTSAENVPFTLDMWGNVGSSGVKPGTPLPPGSPLPPDPPPGFPDGGASPVAASCPDSELDTDKDGFSDEFELAAGTDPCDAQSKPAIGQSIILLLDKSGSMASNNKMDDAKKAAIDALAAMNKATEIAVMAYSGDCSDPAEVVACFSQDVKYLSDQIKTITPSGSTPMSPALLQAREYLWRRGHGQQGRIILLCDGQNSCEPNASEPAKKIFQKVITSNLATPGAGSTCAASTLARLVPSVMPVVEAAALRLPAPAARQGSGQPGQAAQPGSAMAGVPTTAPTTGQGGPDVIPPGVTPPPLIPVAETPNDPSRGGAATVPPGVPAPASLDPFPRVEPYGTTGINTTPDTLALAARQQTPIQVSTIGFGLQNDPKAQQNLAAVASAGGGQTYDAQNLSQLTQAFSQAITQTPAGGGGGGGPVIPALPMSTPMIAAVVLLGACVILIVAILIVRQRGAGAAPGPAGGGGLRVVAGLSIAYADGRTAEFRIGGTRTTIGRGPDNTLVLADEEASSHHVLITASREGFVLTDVGSANGTTVNGQAVTEVSLSAGDVIGIGTTRLTFTG